jgi:hypothetical protein
MSAGSTVQLRLRGLTPRQLGTTLIATAPLLWIGWLTVVNHSPLVRLQPSLLGLCAAAALLPWVTLWRARAVCRAKCDDIAVHARGEALPYKTIRELRVERTPRRIVLHLVRAEDLRLSLVLWDAFAGRLEPLAILRERLAAHGLTFHL